MDRGFDDWKKTLSDFRDSIGRDLQEIRKHKAEVQRIRDIIHQEMNLGHFISDPCRIILSAPEIIIGNVDKWGELKSQDGSKVIIRGQSVNLEGAGPGGELLMRAPNIMQKAVNPGTDGEEDVVESTSEIITMARSVSINSSLDENIFSTTPYISSGVNIHSDSVLNIDAGIKGDEKKLIIESTVTALENQKKDQKNNVEVCKKVFETLLNDLKNLLQKHDDLLDDALGARSNIGEILELNDQSKQLSASLSSAFVEYSNELSRLADTTWKIERLNEEKSRLKSGDEYKKNLNGTSIKISAENIDIISQDGEGNLKEIPGTGINVKGRTVSISSENNTGCLNPEGKINLSALNIGLSTLDSNNIKVDDKGKLTKCDFQAKGNVIVRSKDITLESVDYEVSDGKLKEKALTKGSSIYLRTEHVDISSTDTEGKSIGDVSINSKNIALRSFDVDKDKRTDKNIAQGSTMLILSEKMYLGSKDKDNESKLVQTSSEIIGSFAKNTFEVQQGEKKAVLQMDGGKMSISGDNTGIYGKTTINDSTEVKGELKAPKASIDSVEAKSAFKSPNISDGMAAGGGGGGGSLSPKLQKEEPPKGES